MIDALVALLLSLAVVVLGWRVLAGQRTAAVGMIERMEVLSSRRLAVTVVGRSVRQGVAGRDWLEPAGDSLGLRVFRGWSALCPGEGGGRGALLVSYRGFRAPNPVKDSVLVLTDSGWVATDLVSQADASRGVCATGLGTDPQLWTVDPPLEGGLFRVFERGSYHVVGGALRYRRGNGGRQPMTSTVFAESSGLRGTSGRLRLRLIAKSTEVLDRLWEVDAELWAGESLFRERYE